MQVPTSARNVSILSHGAGKLRVEVQVQVSRQLRDLFGQRDSVDAPAQLTMLAPDYDGQRVRHTICFKSVLC